MTASPDPSLRTRLLRMEEARRQTQHQLAMIDRQITRRMTAMIPLIGRRHSGYRRGKAPEPAAFLERYRSNLAAITAERRLRSMRCRASSPGRTPRSLRCARGSNRPARS